MKCWKPVLPVLFPVILVLSLGLGAVLLPDHTFSTAEMRYLRQFPSCSAEKLLLEDYGRQLEEYASDQFPLREIWVRIAQRWMLPLRS